MESLSLHDVVGNCRIAFDAAECLGIPRVIEPRDMSLLAVPDKLAVMTYLYQLRAHFTGHQLQIEQIGQTSDESSYIIGNYKSDNLSSQNIMSLNHLKMQLTQQFSPDDDSDRNDERSPIDKKDMKSLFLTGSKHLLGRVLSPVKDKPFSTNNNKLQSMSIQENMTTDSREHFIGQRESDDENRRNDRKSPSEASNNQKCNFESPSRNIDPTLANVSILITKVLNLALIFVLCKILFEVERFLNFEEKKSKNSLFL